MNCKPGDLAIVVTAPYAPHVVGSIVRCVLLFDFDGAPCWEIEPQLPNSANRPSYWAVADRHLRPLDNPPDSAADLLLAPLPKQDEVPA